MSIVQSRRARIEQLISAGEFGYAEIARRVGLTRAAVSAIARKLGLNGRQRLRAITAGHENPYVGRPLKFKKEIRRILAQQGMGHCARCQMVKDEKDFVGGTYKSPYWCNACNTLKLREYHQEKRERK